MLGQQGGKMTPPLHLQLESGAVAQESWSTGIARNQSGHLLYWFPTWALNWASKPSYPPSTRVAPISSVSIIRSCARDLILRKNFLLQKENKSKILKFSDLVQAPVNL